MPGRNDAVASAKQVIAENYITDPVVGILEVALNYLASCRCIVFPESAAGVGGVLDVACKRLYVSRQRSGREQRMIVAMGLGYWLLYATNILASGGGVVIGCGPIVCMRDADLVVLEFAAHLLIPEPTIDPSVQALRTCSWRPDVRVLSDMYAVPESLMAYRLQRRNGWRAA